MSRSRTCSVTRARSTLAAVWVASWLWSTAAAQPFSVWFHADGGAAGPRVGTALALHDLRLGDVRAEAWVRVGAALRAGGATHDLGTGASLRYSDTFGPLGTVVVEGGASVASAGDVALGVVGRAWGGARATVANVAVAFAVEGGSAAPRDVDPVRPEPADEAGRQALRLLDEQRGRHDAEPGVGDIGVRVGLTYRPERTLSAHADGSWRAIGDGVAARARLSLRRSGVADDIDAWTAVDLETLGGAASGAYGLGLLHAPRRGPASWLYVWLGTGPNGVWPGFETRWTHQADLGPVTLDLRWRPWLAASTWDVTAGLEQQLVDGSRSWHLGAAGSERGVDVRLSVRWRGTLP